ncbi:MAG: hypothetical protein VB108_00205 [Anaerolineaceae bacterium]|nr:hypothetical protein [Anaerolineaceae bacterium]
MDAPKLMPKFAVLQLSGCSGCEVSLLNADEWLNQYKLVYMPLVITANKMPDEIETLLITGGVRNEEDEYNLRKAASIAKRVVAVGTCAISGGVANLGDRDEVRRLFNQDLKRHNLPSLLPKSHPVDKFVEVDLYLPGCPPTPELFMAALTDPQGFKGAAIVCAECGRKKLGDMKPKHLTGFQAGDVLPDICLVNQGYLCVGTSTRGGCRALCTRPGHPCVGCRGPSDMFIEKESKVWLDNIKRTFNRLTEIPDEEIEEALKSPQLSLFLFQFADYEEEGMQPRSKNKVL